ncbi:MAG: protein phosphatase 2C domain-containing protein [Gemmatimonadaceae bacterium]
MTPAPFPPASRKPRDDEIDVHGLTHVGKVRKVNQDQFLIASIHKRVQVLATSLAAPQIPLNDERLAYLAMIADGVGGLQAGEEASATALGSAMEYVSKSMDCYYRTGVDAARFEEELVAAAMQAHEAVLAKAESHGAPGKMATTLTLYMGVWPTYYLLQVGDSRYYMYRDGTLTQVSRDQTYAQDLVDKGVMTQTAASRTRLAHVLSSALGGGEAAPVVTRLDSEWGIAHLMCSDGLTKHVSDAKIAERLGAMTSAKQVCEALLQDALDDGGSDNITIIVGRTMPNDG